MFGWKTGRGKKVSLGFQTFFTDNMINNDVKLSTVYINIVSYLKTKSKENHYRIQLVLGPLASFGKIKLNSWGPFLSNPQRNPRNLMLTAVILEQLEDRSLFLFQAQPHQWPWVKTCY